MNSFSFQMFIISGDYMKQRIFCLMILILFYFVSSTAIAHSKDMDDKLLSTGINYLMKSDYENSLKSLLSYLDNCRKNGDKKGEASALLWLSRRDIELRNFDSAIERGKEAEKIFLSLKDKNGIPESKIILAEALYYRQSRKESRMLVEQCGQMLTNEVSDMVRIDFYLIRGRLLIRQRKYSMANKNFEEALALSEKINDRDRKINSLRSLAMIFGIMKNFAKADEFNSRAQELAMDSYRPYLQALVQEADGYLKQSQAKYLEAAKSLMGAQVLYKSSGNFGKEGEMFRELADTYNVLSEPEKTVKFLFRAIEAFKKAGDVPDLLEACKRYSYLTYENKDNEELKKIESELKEVSKSAKKPGDKALAFKYLGNMSGHIRRNHKEAAEAFKEAYRLYKSCGDNKGEIDSLRQLAWSLSNTGKYNESINSVEKAVNLRKKLGEVTPYDDFGFYYNNSIGKLYQMMGMIYALQSKHSKAIEVFKKALDSDIAENRYLDRDFNYYYLLQSALATYDVELAWSSLRGAFRDIPKNQAPGKHGTSYNLMMGALMSGSRKNGSQNQYAAVSPSEDSLALMLIERICKDPDMYRKIDDGYKDWIENGIQRKDKRWEITGRLFYGSFNQLSGKYTEARNQYEMALEMAKQIKANDYEALSYLYLQDLLRQQDRNQEADNMEDKLLEVYSQMGDTRGQIFSLMNKGFLMTSGKTYAEAIICFDRALDIAQKNNGDKYIPRILAGRANTCSAMGNLIGAMKDFQKALIIAEKQGDGRFAAAISNNIASIYVKQGKTKEAIAIYSELLKKFVEFDSIQEQRDVALKFGGILEKEKREDEALKVYLSVLNRIIEKWESIPKELGTVRLNKGSETLLLFERVINLLIKTGKSQEALKYLEMSKSAEILDSINLRSIKAKDEGTDKLLGKVQTLRRKMSLIQKEMNTSEDRDRKESLGRILASTRKDFFININEIRSKNPDFEQLLTVRGSDLAALQQVIPQDTLLIEYYPSNDALYIFLVSHDSFQIQKVDIDRNRLYDLIRKFREQLVIPDNTSSMNNFRKDGAFLFSVLLEPVEDSMKGKKQVVLVPGGLLWYLPMEMLGPENGKMLIQQKSVSYLSSSDILKLVQMKKKMADTDSIIAFGSPEGVNLPQTREELKQISAIFPSGQIFTGSNATKENFFKNAANDSIVHIATHSSLNRDDVNKSYIQFAGSDGKLFLGEIYGLPLQPSCLVTLSSCESALGVDNPGREFASLASGFTTAGASSVVASMWKVDDAATAELFVEFYRNLKQGKSRSEALREAKLKLINNKKTSHPFFWGGFVLMGDWR